MARKEFTTEEKVLIWAGVFVVGAIVTGSGPQAARIMLQALADKNKTMTDIAPPPDKAEKIIDIGLEIVPKQTNWKAAIPNHQPQQIGLIRRTLQKIKRKAIAGWKWLY